MPSLMHCTALQSTICQAVWCGARCREEGRHERVCRVQHSMDEVLEQVVVIIIILILVILIIILILILLLIIIIIIIIIMDDVLEKVEVLTSTSTVCETMGLTNLHRI